MSYGSALIRKLRDEPRGLRVGALYLYSAACAQALKSVATRSLAESKLNLGVNEPKVVEVSGHKL